MVDPPDLGVDVDGLLMGNVELKGPGKGSRPDSFSSKRDREQWQRFSALPNLIYTDGQAWALYRTGERVADVSLSLDPTHAPYDADLRGDAEALLRLLAQYFRWAPTAPSTPAARAKLLAPLARLLRDVVLADVQGGGVMAILAEEWRATLFPEADDATFADAYAQTLTYALLLASLEGASPPLSTSQAADRLDSGHALQAQVLRVLGQESAQEAIGMPARLLERVISAVDPHQRSLGSLPVPRHLQEAGLPCWGRGSASRLGGRGALRRRHAPRQRDVTLSLRAVRRHRAGEITSVSAPTQGVMCDLRHTLVRWGKVRARPPCHSQEPLSG